MTSLAVDKIKKSVTLLLSDQSQFSGKVFLASVSELGIGPQNIIQVLTGRERFFPFETNEGEYSFINRGHVVWLTYLLEPDQTEVEIPYDQRRVTLLLRGGKRLRGDLIVAMPVEKSRLSDCLNETQGFLVLHQDKRETLVNMDHVLRVSQTGWPDG